MFPKSLEHITLKVYNPRDFKTKTIPAFPAHDFLIIPSSIFTEGRIKLKILRD